MIETALDLVSNKSNNSANDFELSTVYSTQNAGIISYISTCFVNNEVK